jgi:uncharacterized membrane protein YeiH
VLVLDAAGLGRFTVTGVPAVGTGLIGMLTAIGGGLARDLSTGKIPAVLQRDTYAVVAWSGAVTWRNGSVAGEISAVLQGDIYAVVAEGGGVAVTGGTGR